MDDLEKFKRAQARRQWVASALDLVLVKLVALMLVLGACALVIAASVARYNTCRTQFSASYCLGAW